MAPAIIEMHKSMCNLSDENRQLQEEVERLRETLKWCCDCPTPERRWEEARKVLEGE